MSTSPHSPSPRRSTNARRPLIPYPSSLISVLSPHPSVLAAQSHQIPRDAMKTAPPNPKPPSPPPKLRPAASSSNDVKPHLTTSMGPCSTPRPLRPPEPFLLKYVI